MTDRKKNDSESKEESRTRRKFMKDVAKVSAALAAVHMAQQIFPEGAKALEKPGAREVGPGGPAAKVMVKMDRRAFESKLFTDSAFLQKFSQNPAGTMKSAGLEVPGKVSGPLSLDAVKYVVNSIKRTWGSYDAWEGAHGAALGSIRDRIGKVAIAAV